MGVCFILMLQYKLWSVLLCESFQDSTFANEYSVLGFCYAIPRHMLLYYDTCLSQRPSKFPRLVRKQKLCKNTYYCTIIPYSTCH